MILKKIKLHNFRGYENIEVEIDNNFSVLIGKNDVGKSTILEALEIFFNSDQVKLDENDLYVHHKSEDLEIKIACEFLVDSEIIIDSAVKTSLFDEYLYNKDGLLEICLISLLGKKPKYYINAYYPIELEKPLIQLKINDLKKEFDKRKALLENSNLTNKSISSEMRKAIYQTLEPNSKKEHILIDLSKEDAKNIYNSIQKELPMFFLFKADRENKDGDSEIQNPLHLATKNVLKNMEDELEKVKEKVEQEVFKIGNETIEKMKELDPSIADSLRTSVNTKAWDSIFSFQLIDNNEIPLNKRGSGVRRLLLMSYLRAEAERQMKNGTNTNIIYAIEEPETAQHPNYQKKLMESLMDLSDNPSNQIIITTHTPEIAKLAQLDQIIFIKKIEGNPVIIKNENDKLNDVKNTLGVYANMDYKVVVCVEGENDINFLKNINRLPEFKDIVDLSSDDISLIPMHGGTLKNWIERDYLKNSNIKEIHLYDSDVKSYSNLINNINERADGRRFGFITNRYEMENYIPRCLVENRFNIDLEEYSDQWGDNLDIPKLLLGKVGKNLGRNDQEREKRIKMILNGQVMSNCTYKMIKEMGNEEEISLWFKKIRSIMIGDEKSN